MKERDHTQSRSERRDKRAGDSRRCLDCPPARNHVVVIWVSCSALATFRPWHARPHSGQCRSQTPRRSSTRNWAPHRPRKGEKTRQRSQTRSSSWLRWLRWWSLRVGVSEVRDGVVCVARKVMSSLDHVEPVTRQRPMPATTSIYEIGKGAGLYDLSSWARTANIRNLLSIVLFPLTTCPRRNTAGRIHAPSARLHLSVHILLL